MTKKELPEPSGKCPLCTINLYGNEVTKLLEVVKDDKGNVVELHCTYDPKTRGGDAPDGRKPKATLHWVTSSHSIKAEVRLYDRLFKKANPDDVEEGEDFISNINPKSLEILNECFIEPNLKNVKPGDRFQFERLGYFCVDTDSTDLKPVFNRTVALKDAWAKIEKAQKNM